MAAKWNNMVGMTVSELKQQCERRGLRKSGVKADILNRIREHDDKYPPDRESHHPLRPAPAQDERSPQKLRHRPSTPHRHSEGEARRDQEQSSRSRAKSMGRLTEEKLEHILRQNYLPRENDQNGKERHGIILAEYNVKYEEARNKRDVTISKAETKYKNDVAKLQKEKDEKLDKLEQELAPKLEKRKNWYPAFKELEMLREARGVGLPKPSDFAPRYQGMNEASPARPPRTQASDNRSVASSFNTAPSSLPAGLKRKAPDSPLPSSFTDPPSQRLRGMDDPFIETPRGSDVDMVVESGSIKSQLVDNPYLFLAASNIWLQRGSLQRMKTMIENAQFSPKHIRADETGYFIVFESSVQGDSQAALCFEHFQGRVFNGNQMEMELHRRDRRDG